MKKWVLIAALIVSGCKSENDSKPATSAPPASAPVEVKPFEKLVANLPQQLVAEGQNRPSGTPRIEEMVKAVRAAGIETRDPEQGLGATVEAKYCAASMTATGVGYSMCEYADESGLVRGKLVTEKFQIPDRTIYARAKTLMVIRLVSKTEAARADAGKIVEVFDKM